MELKTFSPFSLVFLLLLLFFCFFVPYGLDAQEINESNSASEKLKSDITLLKEIIAKPLDSYASAVTPSNAARPNSDKLDDKSALPSSYLRRSERKRSASPQTWSRTPSESFADDGATDDETRPIFSESSRLTDDSIEGEENAPAARNYRKYELKKLLSYLLLLENGDLDQAAWGRGKRQQRFPTNGFHAVRG